MIPGSLTAPPFCRCLVHIFKENTVRYSKIRPLNPQCQLDVCRHEVRYGCGREDECFYAHSLIELKVWLLQHQQGETADLEYRTAFQQAGEQTLIQEVSCASHQAPRMKVLFRRQRSSGAQPCRCRGTR